MKREPGFFLWIAKTKPGSIENLPIAGMLEAQAGVRNLQKRIERICRKMATKVVEQWEGRLGLSGLVSQNHAELLVRSRYFWQTNCSRLVVLVMLRCCKIAPQSIVSSDDMCCNVSTRRLLFGLHDVLKAPQTATEAQQRATHLKRTLLSLRRWSCESMKRL